MPLSPTERQDLLIIGESMIPGGARFPAYDREALTRLENILDRAAPATRKAFMAAFKLIRAGARIGRARTIDRMTPAERLAYLERFATGSYPKRTLFRLFGSLLKMSYCNDPALPFALGIEPTEAPIVDESPRWLAGVTDGGALTDDMEIEADVVVIGSGAGGAVAAAELAEQGHAVVIIEQGGFYRRPDFTGRALESLASMYVNQGTSFTVGTPGIILPYGRTVGGTTTINSGTCFRAPERTLTRWRKHHGLSMFSSQSLAPYFARVEAVYQVETAKQRYVGPIGDIIGRGADRLGWSHGPLPRNAPACEGKALCCYGCPTDAKRSTNVSFIPRALNAGAVLFSRVRAQKLIIEAGSARGVEARSPITGKRLVVHSRAVVLGAGALATPLFLRRHRLGDRSGQLGRNLSIHPAIGLLALMDEDIGGERSIPQGYMVDEFKSQGLVMEGARLPFEIAGFSLDKIGPDYQFMLEEINRIASFGFMIEDRSRGSVLPGMGDDPMILYSINARDRARLLDGMDKLARLFFAAGAGRVWLPVNGWNAVTSERELRERKIERLDIRRVDVTAYHPLGSAHMGISPDRAVTKPTGELWDCRNLFVCDGSVVPPALGVNPMITISALAARSADILGARL